MTTEAENFNLSEKILWHHKMGELMSLLPDDILLKKDVKEFIRLLKEGIIMSIERKEGKYEWISIINKLTGDKLI